LSTKVCPNCSAEVTSVANLCKYCFHDFNVVIPKKKSALFTVLFLAVGTAIVSAMAFAYIHDQNKTFKISVDQETKSIVFTTTYSDHTEADRVYFKDINAVEYVKNAQPRPFEVAILTGNKRYVFEQSSDPLDYKAKTLAEQLGAPYSEKDDYVPPAVLEKK
jgi:uncharacterized protein (UPF0333 family)